MSQAKYHPLEELLRLIARTAPNPWYPQHFIRESGADPDHVSALLEHLGQEGLIEKVRGHSLEAGSGVVLTELGQEALRDTTMLDRLIRGEPMRPDDQGAIIRSELMKASKPYATYALIAINVVVYLLARPESPLWETYAARSGRIAQGQWWLLFTCTFLHGGPIHLFMNMFSLYSVGSFVEQAWGRWRYLAIYLVAGWAGSCLGVAYLPPRIPLIGASGAICGVLGAIGVWFLLYRRHIRPEAASNGLWQVGTSVVLIGVMGLMMDNVSNMGHLGGGIGGVLAALALHFQRFGFASIKMQPGLRWAIAGCFLLLLPIASYMQMKNAWAKKDAGMARKNDKDAAKDDEDRPAKKDGGTRTKDIDPKLAISFNRHHQALRQINRTINQTINDMPRLPADIKTKPDDAEAARSTLEEQRKLLVEQRVLLEDGPSGDPYIEQTRKSALSAVKVGIELCDLALAHLKEPTASSQKGLAKPFTDFADKGNALLDRLKVLQTREQEAEKKEEK